MSITQPGKMEIALALILSRLIRWRVYRGFVDEVSWKGDEKVLDFGSGWGDNSYYVASKLNKGGEVTLLDVSKEWQRVAKRRLSKFENVRFLNSDIESANLEDESFDVIVVSYVLHDIVKKDRDPIVHELARKLKSGGIIHLREPTRKTHGIRPDEVNGMMSSAGLQKIKLVNKRGHFKAQYRKD